MTRKVCLGQALCVGGSREVDELLFASAQTRLQRLHLPSAMSTCIYSGTSLIRTPLGP